MIKINSHSKQSRVITCIKETHLKYTFYEAGALSLTYCVSRSYFNKIKREMARLIARNIYTPVFTTGI